MRQFVFAMMAAGLLHSGIAGAGEMNGYAWAYKIYDPANVPISTMSAYQCGMIESQDACSRLSDYDLVDGLVYRSMNKVLWVGVLVPKNTVHEGDIVKFRDAKTITPVLLGAKLDNVARTADKVDNTCRFTKAGTLVIGKTVCNGWTSDAMP
ncbi:MAG: hypothetical protein K2P57_00220 [Burkholderiales bacterium]|nr:hypothetical protein [Burkholderiales bacterium]